MLATDLQRADSEQLKGSVVRAIALVEQESTGGGRPSMLTMRELIEDAAAGEPVITLVEAGAGQHRRHGLRRVGARFFRRNR